MPQMYSNPEHFTSWLGIGLLIVLGLNGLLTESTSAWTNIDQKNAVQQNSARELKPTRNTL